ncbi:receptor kinase-like protein Xa21 isoform X2 [Oryza sativa Japonica Group]|uniref:receptor kinase-like protein Xa21 isoform X2 n=1 Tax=Oryza sativa subsp. japonica TaxID=39947 RepID=UPI00339D2834
MVDMAGEVAFICLLLVCLCSHSLALSPPPPPPSSPVSSNDATKATVDELALLSIKSMLSSPSSSPLASWNSTSSIHHCSWPGVVCSRRHPGRVAALRMASFNLSGAISPFLANLSFLRELDLAGNQLAGEIPPEIGRLGRLETVNLAANALQGTLPLSLGNCTNLMVLNLTSNQLQGTETSNSRSTQELRRRMRSTQKSATPEPSQGYYSLLKH